MDFLKCQTLARLSSDLLFETIQVGPVGTVLGTHNSSGLMLHTKHKPAT